MEANPGGTISLLLSNVAIGDSIAQPGSSVSSVTYASAAMTVVTNLGTTTFSDVSYSGTKPTGYTVSTDPAGLKQISRHRHPGSVSPPEHLAAAAGVLPLERLGSNTA